jgi:ribosome-binding ATPase YchF (GTP1/OBG family)
MAKLLSVSRPQPNQSLSKTRSKKRLMRNFSNGNKIPVIKSRRFFFFFFLIFKKMVNEEIRKPGTAPIKKEYLKPIESKQKKEPEVLLKRAHAETDHDGNENNTEDSEKGKQRKQRNKESRGMNKNRSIQKVRDGVRICNMFIAGKCTVRFYTFSLL